MKTTIILFLSLIILNQNQFSQWTEQNSGVTANLRSVSATDNMNVWVSGYSGTLIKSTNGGLSWINISGNGIPLTFNVSCIFALNQLKAFVIGQSNYVYRTTNAGNNWVEVLSSSRALDAIWFWNENGGVVIGDPDYTGGFFYIRLTSNGGTNWYQGNMLQSNAGGSFKNSICGINNRIWFGAEERIFYTINYGWSWGSQLTNGNDIYAIYFRDSLNGMAGGYNYSTPQMQKTTNGGIVWTVIPSPGSGFPVGITSSSNKWWCANSGSYIYVSTNNGLNWMIDCFNSSTSFSHLTKARNGNRMWAVGSNGKIMMSEGIIGITKLNEILPVSFELYQNYPNPFNPITKIKFAIPLSRGMAEGRYMSVKIIVYNVLGIEIAILVDEQLSPGTYETEWDGSNYASGIYYYRLTAGDFSETKKMILLK